jgi:hypothetical protein
MKLSLARKLMKNHKSKHIVIDKEIIETHKDPSVLFEMILKQKEEGSRPFPSNRLMTNGNFLDEYTRNVLVDLCAVAVDNNWCGRSEMCIYFSCLMRYALRLLGYKAEVHIGEATYYSKETPDIRFTWEHSWVVYNETLIDGNVDTMIENPYVPKGIDPDPYWGDIDKVPTYREFKTKRLLLVEQELDELDDTYLEWKRKVKPYLKAHQFI